jgi:hypothetical protein
MSRILRRPLFRGGPVSSYGTGIASGLADNRRVGLDNGGFLYSPATGMTPTGGQLMRNANTGIKGWLNRNILGPKTQFKMTDDSVAQNLSGDVEIKDYLDEGEPNDWMTQYESWEDVPTWKKNVPFTKDIWETKQDIKEQAESDERAKGFLPGSGPAPMKGVTQINTTPIVVNPNTGNRDDSNAAANQPESTTISADDIREQAALFDKLLNEDYEKDKRSAQIGDASDYALQFFKSTIGEGKGIKEAAGDVAGRALATTSRTEKVQEGKKKTKQTATVMAINEALAQGKSDRELKKILGLADYKGNISLQNAIALANHKDKKTSFFDNYKENRKTMGSAEAAIFTVQETFGKAPTVLTPEQIKKGVVVTDKENIGDYFIYPDGKITFIDAGEGDEVVEKVVLSRGG